MRAADSMASPPLIRMPRRAPRPVATITAVGVARPRAQGQATTRTAMAGVNAEEMEESLKRNDSHVQSLAKFSHAPAPLAASGPKYHVTNATMAMTTVTGT